MPRPSSSRGRLRMGRFTPLELAIAFALGGSILAVAIPTFSREIHASRLVEPVDGLQRIGEAAVEYAKGHPVAQAFPPTASLTPPAIPRGKCDVDPAGTWDTPTWRALDFAPVPPEVPHCFAFSFDSTLGAPASTFRAQAHGDLDGDGIPSTFEVTGHVIEGDPGGPLLDPGMYIDSEVE